MMQATLHLPAFTKGKSQLSALEEKETRTIANVRIHVERVIGMVKQKYPILQSTIPIDFVKKSVGEDVPTALSVFVLRLLPYVMLLFQLIKLLYNSYTKYTCVFTIFIIVTYVINYCRPVYSF